MTAYTLAVLRWCQLAMERAQVMPYRGIQKISRFLSVTTFFGHPVLWHMEIQSNIPVEIYLPHLDRWCNPWCCHATNYGGDKIGVDSTRFLGGSFVTSTNCKNQPNWGLKLFRHSQDWCTTVASCMLGCGPWVFWLYWCWQIVYNNLTVINWLP